MIRKYLLKDEYYVEIEKMQRPWEFVIPEADEIEDCYQNGYPSKERHYRELKDFLMKETEWRENRIKNCLARIWAWTTQGYDSRDIGDLFWKIKANRRNLSVFLRKRRNIHAV